MSDNTHIPWANATLNIATGCTKLSPACDYCYMFREYPRLKAMGQPSYQKSPDQVTLVSGLMDQPLRWRRPRRIFVGSMTDIFHPEIPDDYIDDAHVVAALCPQHRFLFLTKRVQRAMHYYRGGARERIFAKAKAKGVGILPWPLPNHWLGTSVENQDYAWRLNFLAQCPAAVYYCSYEPALGPLDLTPWLKCPVCLGGGRVPGDSDIDYPVTEQCAQCKGKGKLLDWVIAGGESGGPDERMLVEREKFRGGPTHWQPKVEALRWMMDVRNECVATGTAFFFKQWGGPKPTSGGRELGGREWSEFPEAMAA